LPPIRRVAGDNTAKGSTMRDVLRSAALALSAVLLLTRAAPVRAFEEDPETVAHLQAQLQEALRPEVDALFTWFADESDVSIMESGAEARAWPLDWLPVRAQLMFGEVSQDAAGERPETTFNRTAGTLAVQELHATPELLLAGRLTYEDLEDADALVGGGGNARYLFENGSSVSLAGSRESFWARFDSRNPRQYPRFVDLALIEPDFAIDTFSAQVDWVTFVEHRCLVEAAVSQYEDDNQQLSAYAHYQLPLTQVSPLHWFVLRPNIYYETFNDAVPAYFSPDYNVSVGCAAHTVRKNERGGRLELEANPILIFRDDGFGNQDDGEFGLHLVADASAPVWKRLTAGLAAFYYYEADGYDLWRVVARAGCRF
jgi:hypothetical protein